MRLDNLEFFTKKGFLNLHREIKPFHKKKQKLYDFTVAFTYFVL